MIFEWNREKNTLLKKTRGISFDDVVVSILKGKIKDIYPHPNKNKYPNQDIIIVEFEKYIYAVPFVREEEKIFLKTIIPSRKLTKKYLGENYEKN